jgi:uncharacterized coiled-coil protein SlyX
MDALKRFLDPAAAALGSVTAGMAWAFGIAPPWAITIGGLTAAIASVGAATQRRAAPAAEDAGTPPVVTLNAQEERWIHRGDDAVAAIDQHVLWLADGPLRERLGEIAVQAQGALRDIQALAAQASASRIAARQLDASRLSSDITRLTAKLDQSDDAEVEEDLRRSLDAVREQLGIHRRFETALRALEARIESGSLGLQQLAAQVSEMTALASQDAFAQQDRHIEELNAQLDALRSGLSDVWPSSRRATHEADTEGGRS